MLGGLKCYAVFNRTGMLESKILVVAIAVPSKKFKTVAALHEVRAIASASASASEAPAPPLGDPAARCRNLGS